MPSSNDRYLQLRNGIYFIRIAKPPKEWGLKGEFLHTLRTPELKTARQLRDKYIYPLMAETKTLEMSRFLLRSISNADEQVKHTLKNLGEYLGDDTADLTILKLLDKYIAHKINLKMSPDTISTIQGTKNTLERLMDCDKPINEFNVRDVTKWRDKLLKLPSQWLKMKPENIEKSKSAKMSKTTINNHLQRLSSAWKWGQDEGYINHNLKNPAEKINAGSSNTVRTEKPITIEECDALLSMPFPKVTAFNKKVWKYFPAIARYTGARLNEIGQLTTDDIKEIDGILCVDINKDMGKTLKNDQKPRIVPVSDKLRKIIEPLIKECNSAPKRKSLFPNRGDYGNKIAHKFSNRWSIKAKKIGAHCHFHGLRSYMITEMTNAGIQEIDRKRIAGHSDKSTHSGYTKTVLSRLKSAVDIVP